MINGTSPTQNTGSTHGVDHDRRFVYRLSMQSAIFSLQIFKETRERKTKCLEASALLQTKSGSVWVLFVPSVVILMHCCRLIFTRICLWVSASVERTVCDISTSAPCLNIPVLYLFITWSTSFFWFRLTGIKHFYHLSPSVLLHS